MRQKKLSEAKYLKLDAAYRVAVTKFREEVRNALIEWVKANGNRIDIPAEYHNDFYFMIEGSEEQYNAIRYDVNCSQLYIAYFDKKDPTFKYDYCWAFAENDDYIVEAMMNFYFGRPPMFPLSEEDKLELGISTSEYNVDGIDTRTGEPFNK